MSIPESSDQALGLQIVSVHGDLRGDTGPISNSTKVSEGFVRHTLDVRGTIDNVLSGILQVFYAFPTDVDSGESR